MLGVVFKMLIYALVNCGFSSFAFLKIPLLIRVQGGGVALKVCCGFSYCVRLKIPLVIELFVTLYCSAVMSGNFFIKVINWKLPRH